MGDWDNLDAEEDAEFQRRAEALILASSEVEEKFDRGGILSKMFPGRYQEEAEALQIASDQLQADQREARRRRQARRAQEEQAEEERRRAAAKERARRDAQEREHAAQLRESERRRKFAEEQAAFYKQQALRSAPAVSPPPVRPQVPAPSPASNASRGEQRQGGLKLRQEQMKVGHAGAMVSGRLRETKGAAPASAPALVRTPVMSSRPPIVAAGKAQSVREPVGAVAASTAATVRTDASMTGEELVAWRKGRGMTQGALAALLNTTQGNISKAESKFKTAIPAEWVRRLSQG